MNEQVFKFGVIGFLVLLFINSVVLDIVVLSKKEKAVETTQNNIPPQASQSAIKISPSSLALCPKACVDEIKKATSSLQAAKSTAKVSDTPSQPTSIQSSIKEFYIPFGVGSSASGDWTDVAGLQASIDSAKYPLVKSVVFEATIRIPTGNQIAYARLFNATDKHPVWFSDVSVEGGTSQLVISKPITLDSGNKVYQVQMKTSLKYQAFLDQARLHITLN